VLVLRFPQTSGSRQRSDRCADGGFASLLKNCCRSAGDLETDILLLRWIIGDA